MSHISKQGETQLEYSLKKEIQKTGCNRLPLGGAKYSSEICFFFNDSYRCYIMLTSADNIGRPMLADVYRSVFNQTSFQQRVKQTTNDSSQRLVFVSET